MKKLIILTLVIAQVTTLTIFLQKVSNLENARDALILEVSELTSDLAESQELRTESTTLALPKEVNLKGVENELVSASKQESLESPTNDEVEVTEEKSTQDEKGYANMDNVSEIFETEQTDFNWAMKYENNIESLFINSDALSEIGLVSSECRASACKILISRSNNGGFRDAVAFQNEIKKEEWGGYSGFSFEFGNEGQEEYMTLWVKR
jgi:hypothetical protein